jgi:predicted HTH transcriptional regulator
MFELKTKADLQRLIDDGIQESLTLDYKASLALSKEPKPRAELCKDVSALANSAGGQPIYGIEEENQMPARIDAGAAPDITREWIEHVIDSNVHPRIQGLVITPIPLELGYAFVITVPQSTTRGAHQTSDKRYYKRQNFQSVAMEDYEIRDIMRRSTRPDLIIELYFDKMRKAHDLRYRRRFGVLVDC